MELVYLWVEDYKNIHHQGFNFSPRFACSYNEKNNELALIDKEDEDLHKRPLSKLIKDISEKLRLI